MGTHRTESIAGVLVRGVAAGPAFVAPPQLRPWTENQRLSRKRPSAGADNPTKKIRTSTRRMHRNVFRGQYWRSGCRPAKSNFRFGGERLFCARNGRAAMARTPVVPVPVPVGTLSAPMEASKTVVCYVRFTRFETSLKRLKCANSSRSQTARRTRQFDLKQKFPIFDTGYLYPFNLR